MARREHALAPQQGVESWHGPYRPPAGEPAAVDVLVHLSAPDRERLDAALEQLGHELEASGGFVEVAREDGHQMLDTTGPLTGRPRYLEHFGFADGGSQPAFDGFRPSAPGDLPTGELLLGHLDIDRDTSGATAPTELALNGCYLVFRKLEQDVEAFRALGTDDEQVRLVGRRRDGVALTPSGAPDADYRFHTDDPDGVHCPIGSHVRRVNPRDSRPLTLDVPDSDRGEPVEPRLSRRHRMLRRGMPYGEPYPADGERGLLFVALVGDIGRQYEFVQTQWMNEGQAFRLGCDPDVFSGITGPGRKVTLQGDPPVFVELTRPVVTCRGGEYFLLPGVAALRALARA
jgi:Dyp-type peroxidase family